MIDTCAENQNLISIEQALAKIRSRIIPITATEQLTLKHALGRILSAPVYSPINLPSATNSAMDGYAFSSADLMPMQSFALTLAGTSWAGLPYDKPLKTAECIRIFTGAVLPEGADSVILQEQVQCEGKRIIFPQNCKVKENVRHIGTDIKQNSGLLAAHKKLTANDIGLLAAAGIYSVSVHRKLTVAFISTGDELSAIGQPLQAGQIYDSNRYSLNALLNDSTINAVDLGVIGDDKKMLEETLSAASKTHDAIVSTGGASVGDADYIKEVLASCGDVGFWKIAIKPGKPLAFGNINRCYFFGLPGNPASVITTFHKIVSPALRLLAGASTAKKPLQLSAVCTSSLTKAKGRQEYQRGILSQKKSGELLVKSAGKQDSNMLGTMSRANCYIVLAVDCSGVDANQKVIVEPFDVLI